MILIKPKFEILDNISEDEMLLRIEQVARTCYKSEDKISIFTTKIYKHTKVIDFDNEVTDLNNLPDNVYAHSARTLIPKLIKRDHLAMLEFVTITVKLIVDRGVSHELVRHRVASYAQESTRYCNYGNDEHITFVIPSWINIKDNSVYEYNFLSAKGKKDSTFTWLRNLIVCEYDYKWLIDVYKWTPQQARSILPNSLKTEINICANLREWMHIFKLRTAKAAHPDMRAIMIPLCKEFNYRYPVIFKGLNEELD